MQCEVRTGCPGELLLAQWALETGWGKYSPGNNCFGIKEYPGCYGRQSLWTFEWFTAPQLEAWLKKDGRKAVETGEVRPGGLGTSRKYRVMDWFATFPSTADCFNRRAALFYSGAYKPYADRYQKDHDLKALAKGIGPIYATDPLYADVLYKLMTQANVTTALAKERERV